MPNKTPKKIQIMVADDDFSVRNLFRESIKDSKYEICAEATDGMKAIETARKAKPDMAVMDIEMPAMDGFSATKVLIDEGLVHCVVMLTSFEASGFVKVAIENGAEGYITKPFTREQLLSVLDMCYAQSKERYLLKKDCNALKKKIDRKEITNKAKLIIMEEKQLDENESYKYLREMSRRKGISIEGVAEMIITEWESRQSE